MQRMLKSFLINSYFSKHRKNIASTCAQRDALSKCCRLWAHKFTENTWFVRNNLKLFWNLKNNSKQELVQSQYLPLKRHKVNAVLALLILTLNIFNAFLSKRIIHLVRTQNFPVNLHFLLPNMLTYTPQPDCKTMCEVCSS